MARRSVAVRTGCRLLGILGVVALSALPVASHAQNFYAGASIGEFEDDVINDSDTAVKLFGGYQVNKNFALELAYADLGTVRERNVEFDQSTFVMAAVGILPVTPQFAFFGKLGLNSWDVDATVCNANGCFFAGSDSGTDPMIGVGLSVGLSRTASLRVEVEDFEDDIGELLSVGVGFKF